MGLEDDGHSRQSCDLGDLLAATEDVACVAFEPTPCQPAERQCGEHADEQDRQGE